MGSNFLFDLLGGKREQDAFASPFVKVIKASVQLADARRIDGEDAATVCHARSNWRPPREPRGAINVNVYFP